MPAQAGKQLVAFKRRPLVCLVQRQQQRLAEFGKPAQFVGLAAVEVAGAQIDHRVRAQRFLARQRLVRLAAGLAAAGHVGQHQRAAVWQDAVVVTDFARGAAARIAGDQRVRRQGADQA